VAIARVFHGDVTSLQANNLVYELGINALTNGNKKDCAGQTKTNGNDGDQGPSTVTPYAAPSKPGYHGSPLRVKAVLIANVVLIVIYLSKS